MYGWRVRSIRRALAERGLSDGALSVEDLTALGHLDQYHYFGTAACDEAAHVLGLAGSGTAAVPDGGPGGDGGAGAVDDATDAAGGDDAAGAGHDGGDVPRRVLDVGSGVGGPARYLAATTGCAVHGVELREDLVAMARELTDRAGLADRVRYTAGDVTDLGVGPDGALAADAYDHAVAWLVLLHLPDRAPALERMRRAVRPGGTVLVEEFALGDADAAQERTLRERVAAPHVVGRATLCEEFRDAGFVDVRTCDLTDPWTAWTDARYDRFRDRREEFAAVHGDAVYEQRAGFYRTVRDLFADGAVEGVRLTARVPDGDDAAPDPLALHDRERSRLGDRDLHGILEGEHAS